MLRARASGDSHAGWQPGRLQAACASAAVRPKSTYSTKIVPAKIYRLSLSGKSPMDMRLAPLIINKIMLESNPPNSRILVRRLAVLTHVMSICLVTEASTRARACVMTAPPRGCGKSFCSLLLLSPRARQAWIGSEPSDGIVLSPDVVRTSAVLCCSSCMHRGWSRSLGWWCVPAVCAHLAIIKGTSACHRFII